MLRWIPELLTHISHPAKQTSVTRFIVNSRISYEQFNSSLLMYQICKACACVPVKLLYLFPSACRFYKHMPLHGMLGYVCVPRAAYET